MTEERGFERAREVQVQGVAERRAEAPGKLRGRKPETPRRGREERDGCVRCVPGPAARRSSGGLGVGRSRTQT